MIEVKRKDGCITITGHAYYAEPGKDIVCAAVSILNYTLVSSIERLTTDKIEYSESTKEARVKINYGNLSEQSKLLVDSFFVGVRSLAGEYPQNVRVVDESTKH